MKNNKIESRAHHQKSADSRSGLNQNINALMLVVPSCSAPPVAQCKDATVYLDPFGSVLISPSDVDDGSFDRCGVADISIDLDTLDCSNIGKGLLDLTSSTI